MRYLKLVSEAKAPSKSHNEDGGWDFYSQTDYTHSIEPLTYGLVRTGISVGIPDNHIMLLKPRGRNNHLVGSGVLDYGYTGEVVFKLFNPTLYPLIIKGGEGVGQGVIIRCDLNPQLIEVFDEESLYDFENNRGSSGGIHIQD